MYKRQEENQYSRYRRLVSTVCNGTSVSERWLEMCTGFSWLKSCPSLSDYQSVPFKKCSSLAIPVESSNLVT